MNDSNVISVEVPTGTTISEYLRVKINSAGKAVVAGEYDKEIGTILQPVNGDTPGRNIASIAKRDAFGMFYGVAAGAIAAGQKVMRAASGKVKARPSIIMTDDDSAASNGTDVVIVPSSDGVTAYLESTTAGDADAVFQLGVGGPFVNINDNDSPGSTVLYFDEDTGDFLAISPTGGDLLVPVSDGTFIRVKHDASAASNGVAVHFDDDGATASERFLFISPSDADATAEVDDLTDTVSLGVAIEASLADGNIIRITAR